MGTKINVTSITNSNKIQGIVVCFIVVYMMYTQFFAFLLAGFTTSLASVSIPVSDKFPKAVCKFGRIRDKTISTSPIRIFVTNPTLTICRDFSLSIFRMMLAIKWIFITFVGTVFDNNLSPIFNCFSGFPFTFEGLGNFSFVSRRKRFTEIVVNEFLPCFLMGRAMPPNKMSLLKSRIVWRDQFSTTAFARNQICI